MNDERQRFQTDWLPLDELVSFHGREEQVVSKLEGAEDGLVPVLRDGEGAGQVFDLEVRQYHHEKLGLGMH